MQLVKTKRFVMYVNSEVPIQGRDPGDEDSSEVFYNNGDAHPDKIFVFDLDGTMCNVKHRLHYVVVDKSKGEKKQFTPFYKAIPNDTPIDEIVALNYALNEQNIYLITGRSSKGAEDTLEWLAKYGIKWNKLFMRYKQNFEHDVDLKQHMASDFMENIRFAVEDRPRVVQMWRENNVPCIAMPWDQEIDKVSAVLGEKESVA